MLFLVQKVRYLRLCRGYLTFDKGIDPEVMPLPHGWWAANANVLVDDKALDPIMGFLSCRSLLARVVPVNLLYLNREKEKTV